MKKTMRLDKFLATAGLGSRKDVRELVKGGGVTVNKQVVRDSAVHISPETDLVELDHCPVTSAEFVYLMLNKPAGYISATEDRQEKTVLDLVPLQYRHFDVFPVGRLDKDTEGLLLLTNDGRIAHDLLAPKKHVPKTYFVRTLGPIIPEQVREFAGGVDLDDGYRTRPAAMTILRSGEVSEAELTIHEGKFHQVKRMFLAVGLRVIYLRRIAMGGLALDPSLAPGQVRELTSEEVISLRHSGVGGQV